MGAGWTPVLFELAQLIEDYPAFTPDQAGWDARQRLVQGYCTTLIGSDQIVDPFDARDASLVSEMYSIGVLVRAALGLAREFDKQRDGSGPAVQQSEIRCTHYYALLDTLEFGHRTSFEIGQLARAVRSTANYPKGRGSHE